MTSAATNTTVGVRATPQERLCGLINDAIEVVRVARKNNKSLKGLNHYGNRLAELRADATNEFSRLSGSVGDTSALAELMQRVFAADGDSKQRTQAARDLVFSLKTTWSQPVVDTARLEQGDVFPLVTLNKTRRGYLISVGRQANGCYAAGWYDGCAVMMRRLLESVIIEAFESRRIDAKIKDPNSGDFFQLTGLINAALAESSWNVPRNVRKEFDNLRDLGHRSAHNRYYLATKTDLDKYMGVYREAVEAFLHFANLL